MHVPALSTPDALTSVGKVVHELTEQLRIHQPFVLVGLGVGCEHALDFCSTWPSRCAALLLIDPGMRRMFQVDTLA